MSLNVQSLRLPQTAYLLAAGQSRRFGFNKAFAHWQGVPFLNYQLRLLRSCFVNVKVIAPAQETYRALGVNHALVDRFPEQGPLAGLDTALQDALQDDTRQSPWLFLASCDTFGVFPEHIFRLSQSLANATASHEAVLWRNGQHIEPLWGFYATALGGRVEQRLCNGDLAMHGLLKQIQVKTHDQNLNWIQVNAPTDFP